MSRTRVICVLSGGGAKAAAHVGAVRALHDVDLHPAHYIGTSMGAVIGAAFASGLGYHELLDRVLHVTRWEAAVPSAKLVLGPLAPALLSAGALRRTIATLVPARDFDDLHRPLTVTAVDAANGTLAVFGAGGRRAPLLDALAASCALPVYYPAQPIGDRDYLDGGLRAVLPLDLASDLNGDLVFGVHVGPWLLDEPPEHGPSRGLLGAHSRAMRILMGAQADATVSRWRRGTTPFVFVKPVMTQQATFRVEAAADLVAEGYRAGVRSLRDWLRR